MKHKEDMVVAVKANSNQLWRCQGESESYGEH